MKEKNGPQVATLDIKNVPRDKKKRHININQGQNVGYLEVGKIKKPTSFNRPAM